MVVKSEKLFSDLHTHYTESRSTVQCTRCSESQRFFRIGAIPSVSVKQNRVCYEQCLIAACQNRPEAGFTVPKYLMHIFFRTSRQRSDHQLSNPLHLELPSLLPYFRAIMTQQQIADTEHSALCRMIGNLFCIYAQALGVIGIETVNLAAHL